jgi:ABC-type Mn2+/Zn2+ transport system permease subunit
MSGELAVAVLDSAWQAVSEPWSQAIVQRAFAEIALLGVVGGALGCWIVFYELSYSAESLAHAMFPGLVVAALVGAPFIAGGAAGLLVAALLITLAGRAPEIGSGAGVSVVVSSLFGLGALLALSASAPPGLNGLLFGDVLGVSDLDLALAAALAAAAGTVLWPLHRQLLVVGFDRASARALGGRPLLADGVLLVMLALAVLAGVQALGTLLVVTLLVGPAACARLLARRMAPMMALATIIALLTGAGGLYLSYYAETAGGASIAAAVVTLYVVIWVLTPAAGTGTVSATVNP